MRQAGGIRGPATATAGGTVEVEVDGGTSVGVTIPGRPATKAPVQNGRASITLPSNLPSGTRVHVVVLGRIPPEGITIEVIELQ